MLDGKLRIAPTCYHMLHQVPVRAAHEMNYFYDEGLKTADGSLAYELLTDSMVPFGLEKLGISQAMKEKSVDIALDVQSRTIFYQRGRGADLLQVDHVPLVAAVSDGAEEGEDRHGCTTIDENRRADGQLAGLDSGLVDIAKELVAFVVDALGISAV